MKNFLLWVGQTQPLTLLAPYARNSGEGVKVGFIFGVCGTDAANGASVEVHTAGVYTLAKATGATWAVGDSVYWDDTAKNVTKTATANLHIGKAMSVQASGDTSGDVWLTPGKDVAG